MLGRAGEARGLHTWFAGRLFTHAEWTIWQLTLAANLQLAGIAGEDRDAGSQPKHKEPTAREMSVSMVDMVDMADVADAVEERKRCIVEDFISPVASPAPARQ